MLRTRTRPPSHARAARVAVAGILAAGVSAACAPSRDDEAAASALPIARGAPADGLGGVLLLVALDGAACSAVLVSPRVALTAKHCFAPFPPDPGAYRLVSGASIDEVSAVYALEEIHPSGGCWEDCLTESDLAAVVLRTPASEPPLVLSWEDPAALEGTEVGVVGFGETSLGTKRARLRGVATVLEADADVLVLTPSVCQGDSGGPTLDRAGRVVGVASQLYGPRPHVCGETRARIQTVFPWRTLVVELAEATGGCAAYEPERCSGVDEDCDGVVDEGCTPAGEPCERADECAGGLCVANGGGGRCAFACAPHAGGACAEGFVCLPAGECEGYCAAGARGAVALGEPCEAHGDCASARCERASDPEPRCVLPCGLDDGACLAGETCASEDGAACGVCVSVDESRARRGLAERCEAHGDCRSGRCVADGEVRYCSRGCAADAHCPEGLHCRDGACVLGAKGATGEPCLANADCRAGFCARRGRGGWCSRFCAAGDDCPSGLECQAVDGGSICAPRRAALGEGCAADGDCARGLCVRGACGEPCTNALDCSGGFECVREGGGEGGSCLRPPVAPGGCSLDRPVGAARGGAGAVLALAVALATRVRRRRARGARALGADACGGPTRRPSYRP